MATSKVDCDGFERWDEQSVNDRGRSHDPQPSLSASDHMDSDDTLAGDHRDIVSCKLSVVAQHCCCCCQFCRLTCFILLLRLQCSCLDDDCELLSDQCFG